MKPSVNLLKKALEICAKAHKSEYEFFPEYDQVSIKGESVPLVADVRSICRALCGNIDMIDVDFGYTTIYLDECSFLPEANEMMLRMALPADAEI